MPFQSASLVALVYDFFLWETFLKAFKMEELPNFDVLTSSQNSDLDQEKLNETEQKAQAKNTKKATELGL